MSAPRLSPTIVANDALLAAAIDAVIQGDTTDQENRGTITRLQGELRACVSEEAWQVYLQLDAVVVARLADLTVTLTTWAFVEGQLDAGRFEGGGR